MGIQGLVNEAVDRIAGEPIAARMARRAPLKHIDSSLLLITLLLSAYGALMIYSTTANDQRAVDLDPAYFLKRQLAFLVIASLVLIAVSLFDYRHLRGLAPMLALFTLVALLVVLSPLGEVVQGARRWISLGPFQAQPSELAKLTAIVVLAVYLADRKGEVSGRDVAVSMGIIAVPGVLIFLEPDLGTTMVLVAVAAAMLLVAGARLRHFAVLALVGVVTFFFLMQVGLLKDYQIKRLTIFLDPRPDVTSEGYNLLQSKIAIGAGGVRGKGVARTDTQTSLDFVPEQHTDFIFTAVGEQLGFLGSATLLVLFGFLIWRAFRAAALARDHFGTLLASGVAAMWAFHVFTNIGMTMGIMPITGIPLPFLSYGGSFLITNYLAVGLILNIHMRRFL